MNAYRSLNQTLLIALDGTDTVSSENIYCDCCYHQQLKNGKYCIDISRSPFIVAPGQSAVISLRNSDDALSVNWCEVITRNMQGEITYRNAFATSHEITSENVADAVAAARSRWKIENENNNVLKNHGYHFEHNFSHGKQNLANLLTIINLLAFLMHTALDFLDSTYPIVRQVAPSRRTFF